MGYQNNTVTCLFFIQISSFVEALPFSKPSQDKKLLLRQEPRLILYVNHCFSIVQEIKSVILTLWFCHVDLLFICHALKVFEEWFSVVLVCVLNAFEVLADVLKLILVVLVVLRADQVVRGVFVNRYHIALLPSYNIEWTISQNLTRINFQNYLFLTFLFPGFIIIREPV